MVIETDDSELTFCVQVLFILLLSFSLNPKFRVFGCDLCHFYFFSVQNLIQTVVVCEIGKEVDDETFTARRLAHYFALVTLLQYMLRSFY